MAECVFCNIVEKKIPTDFLYEDPQCVLFLDINPSSKGHSLLVSKKHFKNIKDIPEKDFIKIMSSLKYVSAKLLSSYDGLNILQNNNQAAEQVVDHFHVHILPRTQRDNLHIGNHPTIKLSQEKKDLIREGIKKLFKD